MYTCGLKRTNTEKDLMQQDFYS